MNHLNQYFESAQTTPSAVTGPMYGDELIESLGIETLEDIEVEAYQEMAEHDAALQDAEQLNTSLESIASFLTAGKEEGGITGKQAAFVNDLFKSVTIKAPALYDATVMPSNESYDEEGKSLSCTEASLESIGDTAKKVVAAIKSIIEAAMKAALRFYEQHISLAGRLEKSAIALDANIKVLKGEPKEKEVKFSSEFLFADGKELDTTEVLSEVKMFNAASGPLLKAAEGYTKALEGVDPAKLAETNQAVIDARKALQAEFLKVFDCKKELPSNEVKSYGLGTTFAKHMFSDYLAGDRKIIVSVPEEGSDLTATVSFVTKQDQTKVPESMPALNQSQIAMETKGVIKLLAEYKILNKTGRTMSDVGKQMIAAANKAVSAIGKSEASGEQANDFADALKDVKEIATSLRKPYVEATRWALKATSARMKYAQISVRNFKKAD